MAELNARYINDKLVLENSDLREKVSKFFDDLGKNEELAKTFVNNPALVTSARLLPSAYAPISKKSINNANAMLYSILKNPKFMEWLKSYQGELMDYYEKNHDLPDRQKIRRDLAKGLIEAGDADIVYHLLRDNKEQALSTIDIQQPADVAVDIETFIYAVAAVAAFAVAIPAVFIGVVFDEKLNLVTISSNELRSISEQLIGVAQKRSKEHNL